MTPVLLFIFTFVIYLLSNFNRETPYNYFIFLSQAFLDGRLYVVENFPWLNELVKWQGKLYVVYPPMPAILLMPFVAIFGISFHQSWLSIFLAAANVSLSYLVFLKIFKNKQLSLWGSLLYAFGTIQWFHAEVGSAWYIAHIAAMFFVWLAILETVTKKRLLLVGLFIGAAYLSRLPAILAVVFPLVYLFDKFLVFQRNKFPKIDFKNCLLLGLGILPAVTLNFLYNYFRFGTFYDIAYSLLPVFDEPWYKYGLFSIYNIPTHLIEALTALPKFIPYPPFVIPSLNVLAIWFTTPAFILALFANFKNRMAIACLFTIITISLPALMHGNNGFSQFGYRYLMDFYPFLLILTVSGAGDKIKWWIILLSILSIAVNLWGVIMISFLNIWTM